MVNKNEQLNVNDTQVKNEEIIDKWSVFNIVHFNLS